MTLIGTGGRDWGRTTKFALAQLARQHPPACAADLRSPVFERHEVDKRRDHHALNVVERFDAAGIADRETWNDCGYTDASPAGTVGGLAANELPIARLARLIWTPW